MKQHSNSYTGWTMQAGEARAQRQVRKDKTESSATISTVYADKHYTNSERWTIKCTKSDKKLTASNLTTVSIFLTALSLSMLTTMSPAGREKVREEMLGEERGCVPPSVRTM